MRWSFGTWRATLPLPFGAVSSVAEGTRVSAGDVVARGSVYRATRVVDAPRVLGCRPEEVSGLLRVRVGDSVQQGAVIARTGRRFPRAIVAGHDGRLVHVGANGELHVGTVRREWEVTSPLDGVVRRADVHVAVVEGDAWCLEGLAAFGPDRVGALALAVHRADEELAPARLDVSVAGAILVGGSRASGEAVTRAHAVGARGVVAASASFRGLRAAYGDGASAFGFPTVDDVPTLLVLAGFGAAPFPEPLLGRLAPLGGSRAGIHVRAARLYVGAAREVSEPFEAVFEPESDLSAVRA